MWEGFNESDVQVIFTSGNSYISVTVNVFFRFLPCKILSLHHI